MKTGKRFFATLLAMLMLFGSVPMSEGFAVQMAEDKPEIFEYRPDEAEEPWKIPDGYVFTGKTNYDDDKYRIFQLVRLEGTGGLEDIMWIRADGTEVPNPDITEYIPGKKGNPGEVRASVPTSYDARDYGYVMPVEDQVGGTCWAHAVISCMESNYIKKGYGKSIDLSEYHLAWNALNGYVEGNTSSINDGMKSKTEENVYNGGNTFYASDVLLSFSGAVKESRFNLDTSSTGNLLKSMKKTFNLKNRYMYDAVLTEVKYILKDDQEYLKQAIMEYGSVYLSYAAENNTYTGNGGMSVNGEIICAYSPTEYTTDHAVTVVGWNDNFSKNNFGKYKPKNNGAWLIKNSWGTDWGNDGYFWLSYEDKTIDRLCYAFETAEPEEFENVYMYDGYTYGGYIENTKGANVFRADGNQIITKVSYGSQTDIDYTLKIYRNLPENYSYPTQGTLAYTQSGKTGNKAFIDLNTQVTVNEGELFSVVLEMKSLFVEGENSSRPDEYIKYNSAPRESYCYTAGNGWVDLNSLGYNNACIKAITKDHNNEPPYRITFRDPGYYEMSYTTNTDSISLPSAPGYTYVFTYNGQPFTGKGINGDMIVEMHCYPTNGIRISDCTVEYKCYYCNKDMKAAESKHIYTTTKVSATESRIGYTQKKCTVCNDESGSGYNFYPGSKYGKQGNLIWQYVNNNLAILCEGDTPDFTGISKQPWSSYNSLIKKVTVGNGTTRLGDYLFAGMNKLTSGSLPSSITEIGEYCFSGASAFKAFTCPSELRVIEDCAFKDATSLATVNYNKKLTRLGNDVFAGCRSMKVGVVPGTLVGPDAIGWGIFQDCESLEKIVIEEGVTHFDKIVYWGDGSELTEIHIPSTVVKFAAYNFSNLEKYKVSPYSRDYTDVDGVLFDKNLTTLVSYPADKRGAYYNIPDTVTEISEDAFYCTWYLRYLDMSCAVTTLEKDAFNCTFSIEAVNLPSGLKKICTGALSDVSFESLYVPSTVTTIEKDAITANEMNDYYIEAFYTNSSSAAIRSYADNNGYKCYTTHTKHNYSYSFNDTATTEESGVSLKSCGCGCFKVSSEIPRIASVKLSASEVVYNGKTRTPSVIVKDINGNTLVNGTDYTVTYASGRKLPGKYSVAVEFIGDYYGTEYLTFTILPGAPTKVSVIQNTSAIKLSWSAVNGATGYRIFYKKNGQWQICATVTTTSCTFKNLKAGAKYTFAIQPYSVVGGKSIYGKYVEYTTATLPATVTAKAASPSKGKISVGWNAVNGSDGYQVWYKTGNGAYKLYNTYSKAGTLSFAGLKSGTKYTFAVRAGIRTSGGNIFGAYKTATVTVK